MAATRFIVYGAGSATVVFLIVAGFLLLVRPDHATAPGPPAAGGTLPAATSQAYSDDQDELSSFDPAVIGDGADDVDGTAAPGDELISALQDEIARLEDKIIDLETQLQSERDQGAELDEEVQRLRIETQTDRLAPAAEEGARIPSPPVPSDVATEDSRETRLAYLHGIDTGLWPAADARVHSDVLDALARAQELEGRIGEDGPVDARVSLRRELGEVRRQLAPLLERERKALISHEMRSLGLDGDRAGKISSRIDEIIRHTEGSPSSSDRRRAWAELETESTGQ